MRNKLACTLLAGALLAAYGQSASAANGNSNSKTSCDGLTANIVGTNKNDVIYFDEVNNPGFVNINGSWVAYSGQAVINGGNGNDEIYGTIGNDVICGGNGEDWIYARDGNDRIFGQNGRDYLYGDSNDPGLLCGLENTCEDYVVGGNGRDYIEGGDGNDTLAGDNGPDEIHGGIGADSIDGGLGKDTCTEIGEDTLEECES